MPVSADTHVIVSHKGQVKSDALDAAVDKVRRVADHCREPVTGIDVRLTLEPNPARTRPAICEVSLQVEGIPIRAHVAAATIDESVDLVVERLKRRLQRYEDRLHRLPDRRRAAMNHHGWDELDQHQPEIMDLPFDEREVRRQKTFAVNPLTLDEAAFDLDQLGHDFYLFVESSTGEDCLVRRRSDGELEVLSTDPGALPSQFTALPVTLNPAAPPQLTLQEAKEQLDATGHRFVFYQPPAPARAHVLYRRFDGHYGLVTQA